MLASNSAGFVVPVLFLAAGFFAFYLTVRSARMLQNVFATWKFRPTTTQEVQVRPRLAFKVVFKRINPVYGALTYNSVQFDVPPAGHLFQILTYFLLVWGLNLFVVSEEERLANPLAVIVGVIATALSVILTLLMHDSCVRSWNRMAWRELEVKVADNSTILDMRSKEVQDSQFSSVLALSLVLSLMSLFAGAFFGIFSATSSNEEILLPSILACCISCLIDTPLRLVVALVLQKASLVQPHEQDFPLLSIEINPKDVVWLRLGENFEDERNDSFPSNDLSAPFDCSQGFSPKLKNKTMLSCEIVVPRMSPIESEPEQECSEKVPSCKSLNTLASHNVNSEDENCQEKIIFNATPRARSPIKSQFASPIKYSSPVKKKEVKSSGFMYLYEVSMDNEPNAEMSRDYFTSDQEEKIVVRENHHIWDENSFEEEKNEIEEFFEINDQDLINQHSKKSALESETERKTDRTNPDLKEKMTIKDLYLENDPDPTENENPVLEMKKTGSSLIPELKLIENPPKKSEKSLKASNFEEKANQSGKSSKFKPENQSLCDSLDRSEHFPITEDYRADHEGDGEPYESQSPKKLQQGKKISSKLETLSESRAEANENLLSILQKLPKLKKNSSILPKHPKAPNESRTGKTLISLHRKLISFEEDLEAEPCHTQLISPLIFSSKNSTDQNAFHPVLFDEIAKITENDEVTSSNVSKREDQAKTSKNSPAEAFLMDPVEEELELKAQNLEKPANPSQKSLNSKKAPSSESESFDSELSSSSAEIRPTDKKSSRKKLPVLTSNGESEETSNPECYKRYVSRSGDERRNTRPPYRPTKSNCKSKDRSSEREALSSAESKYRPKLDSYFSAKPPHTKDLVKDKKIFDKKNRKEILKNIEKLLEVKENDYDDIEIARLKAMLASRQSFKRKHVETPKETPYNQKIQTVFSDGSTPVEEFRLDPQAVKKREERLKRISSIYTSKRVKSGKKKNRGTLSPSKSENVMKKNSCL